MLESDSVFIITNLSWLMINVIVGFVIKQYDILWLDQLFFIDLIFYWVYCACTPVKQIQLYIIHDSKKEKNVAPSEEQKNYVQFHFVIQIITFVWNILFASIFFNKELLCYLFVFQALLCFIFYIQLEFLEKELENKTKKN